MRSGRKCPSLMLLLAFVGGCGGAVDYPSLTVADSSGVQITTNPHAPSAISLRTLSDVPARDITGDVLFQITAIQALTRDHVGVGVGSSGSVLVYDDTGALIRTLGRTGEGPGEFRSIGNLISIVGEYTGPEAAQDTRRGPARRWMVFGEDGGMIERVQTPEGFVPFSMGDSLIWGNYRDELDVESVRAYRVDGLEDLDQTLP